MIDEPGYSAGDFEIPIEQETTMLKTISAALLAASVFATPVLAAESTKTTANAPVVKTTPTKATDAKSTQRQTMQPAAAQTKPAALNANAKMGKHHRKHVSHYHRHHGKPDALKTTLKTAPKMSLKPPVATTRRG
jgi:hypothetical protein